MRKTGIGILIVILYCFPFVYFSMNLDFANRSMLGYLLMVVVTSILAYFGKFYSSPIFLIIGNLLSAIISFYFIGEMAGNERWGGYFKPLTPNQLLISVSIFNVFPQLLAMRFASRQLNRIKG